MDYSFCANYGVRPGKGRKGFATRNSTLNRCPDKFIADCCAYELSNMTQWVSCRFSCNDEHMIALGDEEGYVTLADVRRSGNSEEFAGTSRTLKADTSVIMDSHFIPGQDHLLITIAGSKEVRIWDLNTESCVNCIGHEMSVRAISMWPDNPHCFLTGARDGVIIAWDMRESLKQLAKIDDDEPCTVDCLPHRKYIGAHFDSVDSWFLPTFSYVLNRNRTGPRSVGDEMDFSRIFTPTPKKDHRFHHKRSRISSGGGGKNSPLNAPMAAKKIATITAVLTSADNYFLSASSSSQSGIRLWDVRYQQCSKPVRTFDVPKRLSKDCGMTSMCWDRFCSKFYATCTDNCIYEFALWSRSSMPIRTLVGAKINSFYVQCAASPLSDHLACGTSDDFALIWDLQENGRYMQDDGAFYGSGALRPDDPFLPFPKFKLDGHKNEVATVSWSRSGRYLVTMDESWLRIWDAYAGWSGGSESSPAEHFVGGVPQKVHRPQRMEPPTREQIAAHISLQQQQFSPASCAPQSSPQAGKRAAGAERPTTPRGVLADMGNRPLLSRFSPSSIKLEASSSAAAFAPPAAGAGILPGIFFGPSSLMTSKAPPPPKPSTKSSSSSVRLPKKSKPSAGGDSRKRKVRTS